MIRAMDLVAMEPDRYWSAIVGDFKTKKFEPPPRPDDEP